MEKENSGGDSGGKTAAPSPLPLPPPSTSATHNKRPNAVDVAKPKRSRKPVAKVAPRVTTTTQSNKNNNNNSNLGVATQPHHSSTSPIKLRPILPKSQKQPQTPQQQMSSPYTVNTANYVNYTTVRQFLTMASTSSKLFVGNNNGGGGGIFPHFFTPTTTTKKGAAAAAAAEAHRRDFYSDPTTSSSSSSPLIAGGDTTNGGTGSAYRYFSFPTACAGVFPLIIAATAAAAAPSASSHQREHTTSTPITTTTTATSSSSSLGGDNSNATTRLNTRSTIPLQQSADVAHIAPPLTTAAATMLAYPQIEQLSLVDTANTITSSAATAAALSGGNLLMPFNLFFCSTAASPSSNFPTIADPLDANNATVTNGNNGMQPIRLSPCENKLTTAGVGSSISLASCSSVDSGFCEASTSSSSSSSSSSSTASSSSLPASPNDSAAIVTAAAPTEAVLSVPRRTVTTRTSPLQTMRFEGAESGELGGRKSGRIRDEEYIPPAKIRKIDNIDDDENSAPPIGDCYGTTTLRGVGEAGEEEETDFSSPPVLEAVLPISDEDDDDDDVNGDNAIAAPHNGVSSAIIITGDVAEPTPSMETLNAYYEEVCGSGHNVDDASYLLDEEAPPRLIRMQRQRPQVKTEVMAETPIATTATPPTIVVAAGTPTLPPPPTTSADAPTAPSGAPTPLAIAGANTDAPLPMTTRGSETLDTNNTALSPSSAAALIKSPTTEVNEALLIALSKISGLGVSPAVVGHSTTTTTTNLLVEDHQRRESPAVFTELLNCRLQEPSIGAEAPAFLVAATASTAPPPSPPLTMTFLDKKEIKTEVNEEEPKIGEATQTFEALFRRQSIAILNDDAQESVIDNAKLATATAVAAQESINEDSLKKEVALVKARELPEPLMTCSWLNCAKRVHTENELYDHVVADHLERLRPPKASPKRNTPRRNATISAAAANNNDEDNASPVRRGRKSTRFQCKWDDCGMSLQRGDPSKQFEWLLDHYTTRHAAKAQPFACLFTNCTLRFRLRKSLNDHLRSAHDNANRNVGNTKRNYDNKTSCFIFRSRPFARRRPTVDAMDRRTMDWVGAQLRSYRQMRRPCMIRVDELCASINRCSKRQRKTNGNRLLVGRPTPPMVAPSSPTRKTLGRPTRLLVELTGTLARQLDAKREAERKSPERMLLRDTLAKLNELFAFKRKALASAATARRNTWQ